MHPSLKPLFHPKMLRGISEYNRRVGSDPYKIGKVDKCTRRSVELILCACAWWDHWRKVNGKTYKQSREEMLSRGYFFGRDWVRRAKLRQFNAVSTLQLCMIAEYTDTDVLTMISEGRKLLAAV